MKAPRNLSSARLTANCHLHDNGGVLDVIFQRTIFLPPTRAGVVRRQTHGLLEEYRRIHVARAVVKLERHQNLATMHVTANAMLVRARLVRTWEKSKPASAAKKLPGNDVLRPGTTRGGAVTRSAAIQCHAVNIRVPVHATKDLVELVRS
jgi:hypothetical protein